MSDMKDLLAEAFDAQLIRKFLEIRQERRLPRLRICVFPNGSRTFVNLAEIPVPNTHRFGIMIPSSEAASSDKLVKVVNEFYKRLPKIRLTPVAFDYNPNTRMFSMEFPQCARCRDIEVHVDGPATANTIVKEIIQLMKDYRMETLEMAFNTGLDNAITIISDVSDMDLRNTLVKKVTSLLETRDLRKWSELVVSKWVRIVFDATNNKYTVSEDFLVK